jgi:hypothetical protein
MINKIDVLVFVGALVLTGVLCYCLGRYQAALIARIKQLEESTPYEPEPVITMGVYEQPKEIGETDAPVGIAESKTPQRVEWETEQSIEKEGKGYPL